MQNEERYKIIKQLWEETGVKESFKRVFENIAWQLDKIYRNSYYDHEILTLKKMKEKIHKITNEINARENIIELLNKLNRLASQESNQKDLNKKLISDSIKAFQHLRVLSVNIINHFIKLRKISSHALLNGKYDLDRISMNSLYKNDSQFLFFFDEDYLIKMKSDTDFLYNSSLNKFFKFSKDSDPFLVSLNSCVNDYNNLNDANIDYNGIESSDKISVPIDENMLSSIKRCQFILLEELVYYELNQNNHLNQNNSRIMTGKISSDLKNRGKSSTSAVVEQIQRKKNELNPISFNKNSSNTKNKLSSINNTENKSPIKITSNESNLDINQSKINKQIKIVDNGIAIDANSLVNISYSNNNISKNSYALENNLNESRTTNKKGEFVIKESELKKIENLMVKHKQKEIQIKENKKNLQNQVKKIEKISIDDSKLIINTFNTSPINKLEIQQEDKKTFNLLKKMDEQLQMSITDHQESCINIVDLQNNEENTHIEIINNEIEDRITSYDIINDDFDSRKLKFNFFNDEINNFQKEYEEYIGKIDEEQLIIFKINSQINFYLKGNFTKIIKFVYLKNDKSSSTLIGIATVHSDPISDNLRLILSSFSVINMKFYFEIFDEFIKFLKSSLRFNELYLELFYGLKNDTFYINENINEIVKKKLKFKWITLENTGTERKTKYRLFNNLETTDNSDFTNTLKVKNLVALTLKNIKESNEILNPYENEINLFCITCLLGEMIYNFDFEMKNQQFKNFNPDKFKRFTKNFVNCLGSGNVAIKEFITDNLSENGNLKLDIKKLKSVEEYLSKLNDEISFTSFINISNKFENILTVKYKQYIYNRIQVSIEVLKNSETGGVYYLIRGTDDNFYIIIGELEENLDSYNDKNMTSVFYQIYSKLDQIPVGLKSSIFLPSFRFSSDYLFNSPKIFDEMFMNREGSQFFSRDLFYSNEINFNFDNSVKSMDPLDTIFSVGIDKENDIMIEKSFMIAFVNLDLLSEMNLPIVSVSIIREEHFLKV